MTSVTTMTTTTNKTTTNKTTTKKSVAVVGSGVSGLVAAYSLHKRGDFEVTLYEKDEDHVGGHAWTVPFPPPPSTSSTCSSPSTKTFEVDVGFQVLNHCTYPNLLRLFEELGVELEASDMSFSVDVPGLVQWGSNSLKSLIGVDKTNAINPRFWKMVWDMQRFKADVETFLDSCSSSSSIPSSSSKNTNKTTDYRSMTLGEFLTQRSYSNLFLQGYVLPMCACIWSTATQEVLAFPAFSILTFMRNHHLLQLVGRPQWLTVKGRSKTYVVSSTQLSLLFYFVCSLRHFTRDYIETLITRR